MDNTLCILVNKTAENTLVGFPYLDGQSYDGSEDDEVIDTDNIWLKVNLGDHTDTTAAQEQFLNISPAVIEYAVR